MLPTLITAFLLAQQSTPAPPALEPPRVSDNSFLVEEAYNQDPGVVQHIGMFQRDQRSGDWTLAFTQEWPAPWNARHQLSYTVTGVRADAGAGLGDTELNWRYQVLQGPRVAFAPRVSVSLPSGNADRARGAGVTALDVNLPVSLGGSRRVTWHLNGGAFVGLVRHDAPRVASVHAAGSAVLLPYRRVNVLIEAVSTHERNAPGSWAQTTTISPGVRWAYDFRSGLQIVPGIGLPIDVARGRDAHWGVIGYLSFEHPFGGRP